MPTQILSNHQLEFFQSNGYIHLANVIPDHYIKAIEVSYITLLKKYFKGKFEEFGDSEFLENPTFNNLTQILKTSSAVAHRAIYDSMQSMVPIKFLVNAPEVTSIVAELAQCQPAELSNFVHNLIMAQPHDSINFIGWHQDQFNQEQVSDYEAGITAWIPMHNTPAERGAIICCPGSHKGGHQIGARKPPSVAGSSTSYSMPEEALASYSTSVIEADRGDLVLFSMNLFHSSGINKTTLSRYTVQTSYFPVGHQHFQPGRLMYISTPSPEQPTK